MPVLFGEAKKLCGSCRESYSWSRATQLTSAHDYSWLRSATASWPRNPVAGVVGTRGNPRSSTTQWRAMMSYGYFRQKVRTYAVASCGRVFEEGEARLEFERSMPNFFIRLRRVLG